MSEETLKTLKDLRYFHNEEGLIVHEPTLKAEAMNDIRLIWNDKWCVKNGFSTNVGIKEQLQKYIMLKNNLISEDLK